MQQASRAFQFGDFVLDVSAYELRRNGRRVRLEQQPLDLLILLVERRQQLVSRAEIAERLWGSGVFVDVDGGIHTAVRKVRRALRDPAERPAFVETVPGKGYRFVAPVEVLQGPAAVPARPHAAVADPPAPTAQGGGHARFHSRALALAGLGVLLIVLGVVSLAWRGGVGGRAGHVLAVLPFENLSGDPDREYLADGLAEETIASLGQIDPDRLRVIGRTSVMAYKHTRKSLGAIARELGADYLLESSIRVEGERLRATAKLIRAGDQAQVWSGSFDRELTSPLGLQQELSVAIAEQIRLRLTTERRDALTARHTGNAEAYDLYLRGLNFVHQRTPPATARAIEYFTRAASLDPQYALAWHGIAIAHAAGALNGDASPLEIAPLARSAAARAIGADPRLAEAQFSLGYTKWLLDWDWTEAERALRRAVALDPNNADVHRSLGHVLSQMGRHDEARVQMRRARELDPLHAMNHAISAQVAFQARDYAAAGEHARQAVALDAELWIGHMQAAQVYERTGRDDLALQALTRATRFSGSNSKALSLRGYILAKTGRHDEARELLKTLEQASRERYVPPYAMALVNNGLGDREEALEWLDRAYDARDVHLMFVPVDPKWDPHGDDPRVASLMAKCGFTRAGAGPWAP